MSQVSLYRVETKRSPFLWREGLCTGHATIDRQHEALYEALLGVSLLLKMPDVNVAYWLDMVGRKIDEYVLTHFKEEERLMAVMSYPGLQAHKLQHTQFIEAFKKYQARITRLETETEQLETAYQLLDFLNDWFEQDVLLQDKDFVNFINQKK